MSIISNVDIFLHSMGSFGYFYLFLFVPPVKALSVAAGGAGKMGDLRDFLQENGGMGDRINGAGRRRNGERKEEKQGNYGGLRKVFPAFRWDFEMFLTYLGIFLSGKCRIIVTFLTILRRFLRHRKGCFHCSAPCWYAGDAWPVRRQRHWAAAGFRFIIKAWRYSL